MNWTQDELQEIEVGKVVTRRRKGRQVNQAEYTTRRIPAPYNHIISQLLMEEAHGASDTGHEAVRSQTYVQRVVDAFWKEITAYRGDPVEFRSKVLTPLLQCQRWGVEENYGPAVQVAISNGNGNPTIADATDFYLTENPNDPEWILNYHRNLLYIPEVRWHLRIIMEKFQIGQPRSYNGIHTNQDTIHARTKCLTDDEHKGKDLQEMLPLSELDVQVILSERIKLFYKEELEQMVCASI